MLNTLTKKITALLIAIGFVGVASAQVVPESPYIDRGARFELPVKNDVENAGRARVMIEKNAPAAVLEKWNGEANMRVSVSSVEGQADRRTFAQSIRYGEGDVEVEMREVENGFKVDFILNSRPSTNEFTMELENTENLDFFYQPELTEEEIAEGAERPENVVGSYAVYHKSKRNHVEGATNYATGKAYHIYRPLVIDDSGEEVWGELDYESGELTVTVPQSFLDTAVYPVVVDPTFGYTSIGASTDNIAAEGSGSRNESTTIGNPQTLSEDATVTQISAALSVATDESGPVFFAVYDEDSAGSDSHDLIVSVENSTQAITTTATFYDLSVSGNLLAADSPLIPAALANGGDGGFHNGDFQRVMLSFDDDAAPINRVYSDTTLASDSYTTRKAEDPWVDTENTGNRAHSIYVTYTATAEAKLLPPIINWFD